MALDLIDDDQALLERLVRPGELPGYCIRQAALWVALNRPEQLARFVRAGWDTNRYAASSLDQCILADIAIHAAPGRLACALGAALEAGASSSQGAPLAVASCIETTLQEWSQIQQPGIRLDDELAAMRLLAAHPWRPRDWLWGVKILVSAQGDWIGPPEVAQSVWATSEVVLSRGGMDDHARLLQSFAHLKTSATLLRLARWQLEHGREQAVRDTLDPAGACRGGSAEQRQRLGAMIASVLAEHALRGQAAATTPVCRASSAPSAQSAASGAHVL